MHIYPSLKKLRDYILCFVCRIKLKKIKAEHIFSLPVVVFSREAVCSGGNDNNRNWTAQESKVKRMKVRIYTSKLI